ncbi:MAG: hypothetical protein PVG01_07595 [Desulfobacterales bacterium]
MRSSGRESLTGKEPRTVVLGHLLRGGIPTSIASFLCVSAPRVATLSITASPASWSSSIRRRSITCRWIRALSA